MNFFNYYKLLPFNFKIIITVGLCFALVILILRWLIYSIPPSYYINVTDKVFKWKYKGIITNNDVQIRKKKIKFTKKVVEITLLAWTSIYLGVKNLVLRVLLHPLILILLFFCWFKFIHPDVYNTINLYSIMKVSNPNDQYTLDILNAVINGIRILAPLSLPFYYFAYKEQKTISDSSTKGRTINTFLILFLLFSLSTLGFSMNVKEGFKSVATSQLRESLDITKSYKGDLALISLYALCSFYCLFRTIYELLSSINLEKLIKRKINKVYFHYFLMSFGSFKCYSNNQYQYLGNQLETVYQALNQAAEKNLGGVYEKNFEEWSKLLDYMLIEYRLNSFDTTTKHLHLLNRYKKTHIGFYKIILKNHKSLIINLVKEHKIQDAKNAINKLLDYIPSPIQLIENKENDKVYNEYLSTYYVTLYEILTYLYDNKNIGVYPVLDKINSESKSIEAIEQEGIIRNLQSLIIRSVENNDVKMLSAFSYYLSSFSNQENQQKDKEKSNLYEVETDSETIIIRELEDTDFESKDEGLNKKVIENEKRDFLFGSIFILLQALLKSIELTHYKSTGFLVKFLITSFDSEIFNNVFEEFYNSPYNNIYLPKKDYYKEIDDDFHFNSQVEEYIFVKLFILIYAQQKYIVKNNVDFWKVPKVLIDTSMIVDSKYLDYMFNKLEKAKKEYGLLYLEDKEFIDYLKVEFGIVNKKDIKKPSFLTKALKRFKNI